MVPNTTYWLIHKNQIVACSHLRHTLNESLRHAGGHIGLGVRPSYRGKGLSTYMLNKTLEKARQHNINPVHIHCYADNDASIAMITACNGQLMDSLDLSDAKTVLKYVVE